MIFLFENFAESRLAAAVGAASDELLIAPSDSVRLPQPNGAANERVALVLFDGVQMPEIVHVVVNPRDGSLEVERGREGTAATAWKAGTAVINSLTKESIAYFASGGSEDYLTAVNDRIDNAFAAIEAAATGYATDQASLAEYKLEVTTNFAGAAGAVAALSSSFADISSAWAAYQVDVAAAVGGATANATQAMNAVIEQGTVTAEISSTLTAMLDGATGVTFAEKIQGFVDSDEAQLEINTDLTSRLGTAEAGLTSEISLRSTQYTAQATINSTLTSGVAGNAAAITTEATTRVTADTALAGRASALEATVDTPTTGLSARMTAEETTRSTQYNALASRADTLEATATTHGGRLDTIEDDIGDMGGDYTTLAARVTTEETATADLYANKASASSVSALSASLTTETSNRTAADISLQTQIDTKAATSTVTALDARVEDTEEAVVDLEANKASASSVSTLSASLTTETASRTSADTTLTTNLTNEVTNRTNADTTINSSITTVSGRVTTLETAVTTPTTGLVARTTALETTIATKANSSTVTALDARVTTAESAVVSLTANKAEVSVVTTLASSYQTTAALDLPSTFDQDGKFWIRGETWTVNSYASTVDYASYNTVVVSYPTVAGLGKVLQLVNQADIAPKGLARVAPGRKWQGSIRAQVTVNGGGGNAPIQYFYFVFSATTYLGLVSGQQGAFYPTVASGLATHTGVVADCDAILAAYPTAAYVQFYCSFNTGSGGTTQVQFIKMEDVTDTITSNSRITSLETTVNTPTTGLAARTTTLESSLTSLTTTVGTKANSSTVTSLDARVGTAESAITTLTSGKAEASVVTALSASTDRAGGGLSFNRNPTFQDWTGSFPNGYVGTNITATKRTSGALYGAWALQLSVANTSNSYHESVFASEMRNTISDEPHVVFEWEVTLDAGDFGAAGLFWLVQYTGGLKWAGISLNAEHPGAVVGRTYRGARVVPLSVFSGSPASPPTVGWFYQLLNHPDATGTASVKTVTFHRALIRAASDEEIAASSISDIVADAVSVEARTTALETVVTTPTTGLAARTTTLESTITTKAGTSVTNALDARLTTAEAAVVTLDSGKASVSSVTSLTSTVNGHTASLTTVGETIADHTGYLESHLEFVAAAGENEAYAVVRATDTGSEINLVAQKIGLGRLVDGIVTYLFELTTEGVPKFSRALDIQVGAAKLTLGPGFGVNGDLLFWFGPSMDQADMSKTNASIWMDNVGGAYFATVTAGVLTNSNASSGMASNEQVICGPFGTNGDSKTVTVSWTYSVSGYRDTSGSLTSSLACTVTLYRSINGGGYTEVASGSTSGNGTLTKVGYGDAEAPNPFGGTTGILDYTVDFGHSKTFTFTDTNASTDDFAYKAVIARTGTVAISGTALGSDNISQRVSILVVEE